MITKEQARIFLLMYQELLENKSKGKDGVYQYILKVGSIQFDPLSVIDTNPQLVLQSRFEDYKKSYLTDLLYKDRLLVDDWDKNMCIYPISDWPKFSLYRQKGLRIYSKENYTNSPLIEEVKQFIRSKGPICSGDLDMNEKVNWFWGDTRVSRVILESMYLWGDVVIHHKDKNRKYYDLTENVIPKEILNKNEMSLDEYSRFIVKRRIGSVGLLWNRNADAWLGIMFIKSKERQDTINNLIKNNELVEIKIEGIKYPFYLRKEDKALLDEVIGGITYKKKVSFIAPLDNLIWDRALIKELFDFDYTWEVYKPAHLREYGYYVLPVLYGDKFIGRFEPRFNKMNYQLEIHNWWWEKNVLIDDELKGQIIMALNRMCRYLGAKEYVFLKDNFL